LEEIYYPLNARVLRKFIRPALNGPVTEVEKVAAALLLTEDGRRFVQQGTVTVHAARRKLHELSETDLWLRKILIHRQAA
jgi:hypothetical protein